MHGWIRHPVGAVTVLASAGQDPARGPWGPGSASAFPRCRDLARSSPLALACGGGCFPFPSRSLPPKCPNPLAACATCPCSSHQGHHWAQASLCTWLGACKNLKLGCFSLNLSLTSKSVRLWQLRHRAAFGVPLGQRVGGAVALLARMHGDAPAALALGRWFAAQTWVFPGRGAAPARAAGRVSPSPVPPTCLQVRRAGHGTLFTRGG